MADCKNEQRVNIKFPVKLNKSAIETFHLLTEAYGEDCMSRARVFEWHERFSEGRESVTDNARPGRPRTTVTDENIEKVRNKHRRLGVRAIAEEVHLDRESFRHILTEKLNPKKVCAKMVPKMLSDEQKGGSKERNLDLLKRIEDEPDLLDSVITCD
ncbi:protein GVQW3-like [Gigantopelta aegis]|uniref:protein GVQW3-like n=1 Tax=Gigantopelta aegis TaxID=1735272 RepID=UPI001B889F84|nr:protein GVQW3-like [Gigantopelta aegis]